MIAVVILLVLIAALFWLVAGRKPSHEAYAPFQNLYVTHRGLHSKDLSVPENSLAAFKAAAEAGYGIELDLQLSSDGEVMVFHDDSLKRVCGVEGLVEETPAEVLKSTPLHGTEQTVPLFKSVLELVAGRSPLIVELKHSTRTDELCRKAYELLKSYDGAYCIESFDPFIVAWFCKNAPHIVRGQLITSFKSYRKTRGFISSLVLSCNLMGFKTRPNFIAHDLCKKNRSRTYCGALRRQEGLLDLKGRGRRP